MAYDVYRIFCRELVFPLKCLQWTSFAFCFRALSKTGWDEFVAGGNDNENLSQDEEEDTRQPDGMQHAAAAMIQGVARGRETRKQVQHLKNAKKEEQAVLALLNEEKAKLTEDEKRLQVASQTNRHLANATAQKNAVSLIQGVARGHQTRKEVKSLKAAQQEEAEVEKQLAAEQEQLRAEEAHVDAKQAAARDKEEQSRAHAANGTWSVLGRCMLCVLLIYGFLFSHAVFTDAVIQGAMRGHQTRKEMKGLKSAKQQEAELDAQLAAEANLLKADKEALDAHSIQAETVAKTNAVNGTSVVVLSVLRVVTFIKH